MAQLKGKGTVNTASSGQKSAFVMWRTIEIESTIPWVGGWRRGTGWWWVEGSSGPLEPPEKGGQRKLVW